MDKKELRIYFKEKRKNIIYDNTKLIKYIQQTKEYKCSKNIMIFYPLKYEINLLQLLEDKSKHFYLPKINGKNLQCCPFNIDDRLTLSKFNTKEPTTKEVDKNEIDLIIVPALCCDKNNHRLGYGGGYYDRLLKDYHGKTMTCLPKELIIDSIPNEKFDIPINIVLKF